MAALEAIADKVEAALQEKPDREIATDDIGAYVMRELRHLDQVAFVRFASVYRNFRDIDEFKNQLNDLSGCVNDARLRVAGGRRAGALGAATLAAADVKVTTLVADGKVYASFSAPSVYSSDARDVVQERPAALLRLYRGTEARHDAVVRPHARDGDRDVVGQARHPHRHVPGLEAAGRQGHLVRPHRAGGPDADVADRLRLRRRSPRHDPLEPNAEYYVQVRVHLTPRRTFSLWPPWGHDDGSGRADFTFIR